jgi:hypothetical protein
VRQRRPNTRPNGVAEGPEATGHSNALPMRCPQRSQSDARLLRIPEGVAFFPRVREAGVDVLPRCGRERPAGVAG